MYSIIHVWTVAASNCAEPTIVTCNFSSLAASIYMKNEFTSVAILVLTSCCLQFLFSIGGIRHVADARGMLPLKKIVIWFPSTAGVSLVNLMKNTVIEREYYKVIHINLTMQCYTTPID